MLPMTINGLGTSAVDLLNGTGQFNLALDTNVSWIAVAIVAGLIIVLYICQAILAGALARSKGYSFFGNFLLGLVLGIIALIYEAGRPVSYERECVMQDRLAMQTAKELYKLQRAREKAQANGR
ncbi:MAG TPA: hypothetical protein IAA74_06985 [Candidatus Excrementavichristensenella intestinipullorum]|nr:hypothetical protein [Candidatus Excrementavichristensenella intestinipullorum]